MASEDWQELREELCRVSERLGHQHVALEDLNNRRCATESRIGTVEEEVLRKFQVVDHEVRAKKLAKSIKKIKESIKRVKTTVFEGFLFWFSSLFFLKIK